MRKMTGNPPASINFPPPPPKLGLFFSPDYCRYRVAYGGRASGKSWAAVEGLIIRALQKPVRILCCREYQVTIRDSIKKVIEDSVNRFGISAYFTSTESEIRCFNGSVFMFRGLHNNVSEIKSLENISIAYVEEAESVSEHSWNTLIPTVRAENSEIWVVFNPRDEKDATYQRFVVHPPENSRISFINYTDNPYCPTVMAEEAENCRRLDFDLYSHIWLGRCRKISEAAVFHGKFEMYEFDPPDEAKTRFYYGLDFGYSTDPNAFIRCFVEDNELFIDYEAGGTGIDLDEMPQMLDRVPGSRKWPIRADNARPETIAHLRRRGFNTAACAKWKGSVEDGIGFIRSFERIYIHPRCRHVYEEFQLYSYKIDKNSGEILPIVVDAYNHYCDALRYALEPLIRRRGAAATGTMAFSF